MFKIGVDIGTTSTKAVIYKNQDIVGIHHVEYPLLTPTTDTAEQYPNEIFEAVLETIQWL